MTPSAARRHVFERAYVIGYGVPNSATGCCHISRKRVKQSKKRKQLRFVDFQKNVKTLIGLHGNMYCRHIGSRLKFEPKTTGNQIC